MFLKRNLNTFDRAVRLLAGAACVYVGFIDGSLVANPIVATAVGLFGIINIFAFTTAYCPIYAATGVSTFRPCCTTEHDA